MVHTISDGGRRCEQSTTGLYKVGIAERIIDRESNGLIDPDSQAALPLSPTIQQQVRLVVDDYHPERAQFTQEGRCLFKYTEVCATNAPENLVGRLTSPVLHLS